MPWARRPQVAALVVQLPDPDRGWDAIVIGEYERAFYAKLYPFIRPALVNGAAGALVTQHGHLFSVMAFTITDGKITQIDALADPDRLAQLNLTFPDTSP